MTPLVAIGTSKATYPLVSAAAGSIAVAMSGGDVTAIVVAGFTAMGIVFSKLAETRSKGINADLDRMRLAVEANRDLEKEVRAVQVELHQHRLGVISLAHQLRAEGFEPDWKPTGP